MKKICILICCVLLLQMCCACASKKNELKEPVNFYYGRETISYNSDSGVIQPELREGSGFHGNVTALLHAYLLGPSSSELRRLIPADVYLVSCDVDNEVITIELSNPFSKISGIELSTACSALLLTVHDYTGAETLYISTKDGRLEDKDTLMLKMDDIVLIDTVNNQ